MELCSLPEFTSCKFNPLHNTLHRNVHASVHTIRGGNQGELEKSKNYHANKHGDMEMKGRKLERPQELRKGNPLALMEIYEFTTRKGYQ